MTAHTPILSCAGSTRAERQFLAACRAWQAARLRGGSPVQALHALLAPAGSAMLAPAIDSTLSLTERALARPLGIGSAGPWTPDEGRLRELLLAPARARLALAGGEVAAQLLACALLSLRALMRGERRGG